MDYIDKGGPAFPAHNFVVPADLEARHVAKLGMSQGMTLRDYFAAKALHASWATWHEGYFDLNKDSDTAIDDIARLAYQIADAMLKARG